jgi:hypothetical protein
MLEIVLSEELRYVNFESQYFFGFKINYELKRERSGMFWLVQKIWDSQLCTLNFLGHIHQKSILHWLYSALHRLSTFCFYNSQTFPGSSGSRPSFSSRFNWDDEEPQKYGKYQP